MNKFEFQQKLDEANSLIENEKYTDAVEILEDLQLNSVRDAKLLQNLALAYEKCRKYDEAEDLLLQALESAPKSRGTLFRLCTIAIKADNLDDAHSYYDDYCEVARFDSERFILQYRIAKAEKKSDSVLMGILEKYKDEEPDDKWMYELAKLYAKNGRIQEALELCDEITLWFYNGKYVTLAKEFRSYLTGEPIPEEEPEVEEESTVMQISRADRFPDVSAVRSGQTAPRSEAVAEEEAEEDAPEEAADEPEKTEAVEAAEKAEEAAKAALEAAEETAAEESESVEAADEETPAEPEKTEEAPAVVETAPAENASSEDVAANKKELVRLKNEIADTKASYNKLLVEMASSRERHEKLKKETESFLAALHALEDSVVRVNAERKAAAQDLEATKNTIASLEKEAEELRSSIEASQKSLDEANEALEAAKKELESYRTLTEEAKKEVEDAKAEAEKARADAKDANEEADAARRTAEAVKAATALLFNTSQTVAEDEVSDEEEIEVLTEDEAEVIGVAEIEPETEVIETVFAADEPEVVETVEETEEVEPAEETEESETSDEEPAEETEESETSDEEKEPETVEEDSEPADEAEEPAAGSEPEAEEEPAEEPAAESEPEVEEEPAEEPEQEEVETEPEETEEAVYEPEEETFEAPEEAPAEGQLSLSEAEIYRMIREKIAERLDGIKVDPDLDNSIWHIMVYADSDAEALEPARNLIKRIEGRSGIKLDKTVKIHAAKLYGVPIHQAVSQFIGRKVIIQSAGLLSNQQLEDFASILRGRKKEMLICFTDTLERLVNIADRVPEIPGSFSAIFNAEEPDEKELMNLLKAELAEKEARLMPDAEKEAGEFMTQFLEGEPNDCRSKVRAFAASVLYNAEHSGLFGLFTGKIDDEGILYVSLKHVKKAEGK